MESRIISPVLKVLRRKDVAAYHGAKCHAEPVQLPGRGVLPLRAPLAAVQGAEGARGDEDLAPQSLGQLDVAPRAFVFGGAGLAVGGLSRFS